MDQALNIYNLNTAEDLFSEIQDAFSEYSKPPSERTFLFLIFSLNHLREWIAKSSYRELDKKIKKGINLTPEEKIFYEIGNLKEFKIINEICNKTKHHIITKDKYSTSKVQGFRAGLGRCGDSLDQEYFLINGQDSRNILLPIIRFYYEWFEKQS